MEITTNNMLYSGFQNYPVTLAPAAASKIDIQNLESQIGFNLPDDYKEFLLEFGSGKVGPFPIYGIGRAQIMVLDETTAWAVTNKFSEQLWPGVCNWLVISMDNSGNPVELDRDGLVWISDHDYGSIDKLAHSFEDYLWKWCWDEKYVNLQKN